MFLKKGFTFIELVVAIAILALLVSVAIPAFRGQSVEKARSQFISRLNSLSRTALQNALTTQRLQRIVFDLDKKEVYVEEEAEEAIGKGWDADQAFSKLYSPYALGTIKIPKNFEIFNFFIFGKDEMEKRVDHVWYFITPTGLAQEVIINIEDKNASEDENQFGLVLNPFSAQFKSYETVQTPIQV